MQATCTDGPSFPTESPEAITRGLWFKYQDTSQTTRSKNSHQCQTLDEERPKAEESWHDETRYDALDLGYPRAGCVLGQRSDETSGDEGKRGLFFCFVSGFDSRVHQLLRFWAYRKKQGNESRTANNTYMNQRATDTVLHRCQESHPLSSSPSSSQQQNC